MFPEMLSQNQLCVLPVFILRMLKTKYFWLYHVNICVFYPFVCVNRTIAESKKKHEEKQMKAQQLREKLREEKTLKLQKLLERVSF